MRKNILEIFNQYGLFHTHENVYDKNYTKLTEKDNHIALMKGKNNQVQLLSP